MTDIHFHATERLNTGAKRVIRAALDQVYGAGSQVNFIPSEPGKRVVSFGPAEVGIVTLSPKQMLTYPNAVGYVASAFMRLEDAAPRVPTGYDPHKVLYFDIESHNAGKQWDMDKYEFVRLCQYAWGPTGDVVLTTNLDEALAQIRAADLIIAHNGLPFDFSVTLEDEALDFAKARRLFDTMTYANLALPAPPIFTGRDSKRVLTVDKDGKNMVGGVKKWLSLDNLAFQLGIDGKEGNLRELTKKYNPKGTRVDDLDYSLIPLDDPDFLAYARQDIVLLQNLTTELLRIKEPDEYDWREQTYVAINSQMTRNGFRVDVPKAQARVRELAVKKQELLDRLVEQYGFPTEGKAPWSSNPGKEAIFKILADAGITPETHPEWTRTATGNLSLGGETLIELTQGTPAEELGQSLAELKGQRPLAEQALMFTHSDGRVHHDIAALQRSGRCSTTKPSLTTWSAHGPKAVEKEYFIATEGRKLMEFDLSNADQRIIAAISDDQEYAKRFEEGVDGHEINGRIMFGDDVYDSDPAFYRDKAKAPGHAWTYGGGPKKLAWTTGLPLATMEQFADGMAEKYPVLTAWQLDVRRAAERDGYTVNRWGRKMVVDPDRFWTMTPALQGQSGTAEVLKDGLIRMLERDRRLIDWMVGSVHDALVADLPIEHLEWGQAQIIDCLETEINGIEFPVSYGQPADDWYGASH